VSWDAFVRTLQAAYSFSVTSWWRTIHRNETVGGCRHSKHLNGEAIDVVYDGHPPDLFTMAQLAHSSGFRLIREATHDHIERS